MWKQTLCTNTLFTSLQVVIFVKNAQRAVALGLLLEQCQFPACVITAQMKQPQRLDVYK